MSKDTANIIVVASLTSLIFILILASGLDFIFMFLSTLPLFAAGLSKDPRITLKAGALATLPIAVFTGSISLAVVFFLVFVLPSWYFCLMVTRHYDIKMRDTHTPTPTLRLWYPTGLITVNLAVYGCVMLATITAIFATQEVNLPTQINQVIQESIELLKQDYALELDVSNRDFSYLVCALLIWIWHILLLVHALLANNSLIKRKMAKRPSFMITPFPIPNWLLSLMAICALASLIGGESMRFLGKASIIILLLPYFFQGAAIMHLASRNWPNRRFFLFLIYFSIVLFFWPAIVIAGAGLWDHVKFLNKHLSSGGTSSKS